MCVGNDNLHLMTRDRRQRLRVNLADWEGNTAYAEYDNFAVDSAQEKYRLSSLGTYHGNASQYDVKKCNRVYLFEVVSKITCKLCFSIYLIVIWQRMSTSK